MIWMMLAVMFAGTASVTAYTHTGNPTSSGRWPVVGVTAACHDGVRLGTWIVIESVGARRCDDRIGRGADFDVFVGSREEAVRFGRRGVRVAVLR